MIKLNITANTKSQETIKKYLEENVSQELAVKINNGVNITKDNKTLFNKKDLEGFFSFAYKEARNLAEKNASSICIEDETVFGWAIHYFEEDTIEGNLFNLDGSPHKEEVKTTAPKITNTIAKPKETSEQYTLFDVVDKVLEESKEEEPAKEIIDMETGEILNYQEIENNDCKETENNSLETLNEQIQTLFKLFGETLEVKYETRKN